MTLDELRELKRQTGFTNAQLSEYSGVPVGTVNKIMSGGTKKPRMESLAAIEKVLLEWSGRNYYEATHYYDRNPLKSADMLCESKAVYGISRKKEESGSEKSYTLADYLKLSEDRRIELIDGKIYDMASPTITHQRIAGYVYRMIVAYITEQEGSCEAFMAPLDVELGDMENTVVQPDVMIVCDEKKTSMMDRRIVGAPDFVLEVVSSSSITKDYIIKAHIYLAAGVREYWIIDPMKDRLIRYDMESDTPPVIQKIEGDVCIHIYDDKEEKLLIHLDELRKWL